MMTPSSKSEPELETLPAKSGPPEIPDPTSPDAPTDVDVVSESPAGVASTTKVVVTETQPAADTEPVTGTETVTGTGPAAEAEPVTGAPPAAEAESTTPTTKLPVDEPSPEVAPTTEVPVTVGEPVGADVTTPSEPVPVEETEPRAPNQVTTPAAATGPTAFTTPAKAAPTEATPTGTTPTGATPTGATAQADAEAQAEAAEDRGGDDADDEDTDEDTDYEVLGSEPSNRFPTIVPLIGALLGLTALAALMVVAFALPAVKSAPRDLPIGVAGSAEINTQLRELFSKNFNNAFTVTSFSEEDDLRAAIEDKELYGGLSVTESSVTMLVSSAASPAAAQTLSQVANTLSQGGSNQIPVVDVVPLPKEDPRGDGLAAANLPIVIAAILPALVLIPIYRRRVGTQVGVAVGASVLIGLGLAAVLDYVVGSTAGSNFLLVSIGLMAGVLATSLVLLGLHSVAGRIGAGVGVALLVLLAAPLTGLATAPEWLPQPWGTVGQFLPPGANATLLRSTAYFDGLGWRDATVVLAVWALIGLILLGAGALLKQNAAPAKEAEPEPAAV
jgi:hypothetical protein